MVNGMQAGLNAVTGFVGRFLDAGRDIVNGIVKGVTNGKDAVVNKIKDICSGALDAVKSFFGIKSPSKVMAKMFGYVMQGAKLGITQNAGSLMDTFNQATQLLPSAMDVPVTMSAGGFSSSVASLLGAGGSNTQNTNSNVTVGDVTINTRQEDSRFMQLITRSSELADAGIVGAGV
jgi:phage-related protein